MSVLLSDIRQECDSTHKLVKGSNSERGLQPNFQDQFTQQDITLESIQKQKQLTWPEYIKK